jgi:SurA-like N-terminal domain
VINGYEVDIKEFRHRLLEEEHRLQSLRQQFGPQAEELLQSFGLSGRPEEMAINALIHEKLLLSAADTLGIRLSPEYIKHKLQDPAFLIQSLGDLVPPYLFDRNGSLNQKALLKYLQRRGMTMSDFEQALENALKSTLVLQLVTGASYVPQAFIKERFIRDYSSKKFTMVVFDLASYLPKKKEVTDEEKKTAHEALIKAVQEAKTQDLSQLTSLAQQHKAHIEKTALLAPDAAGWEELKKKEFPIERMKAMDRHGEMIEEITPEKGFIIQLQSLESAGEQKFQSVKNEIAKSLLAEQAQEMVYAFVASLHKNATINVNQAVLLGRR